MLDPGRRTPRPVPVRGAGYGLARQSLAGGLAIVAVFGAWELGSRVGWIDPQVLPGPVTIGRTLVRLLQNGDLSRHLSASLTRLTLGWGCGTVAGVAVGMALGLHAVMRSAGLTLVWLLASIPQVTLVPLFLVWFESDEAAKIAMVAFGVLFPTAISTAAAVGRIDRTLIRMAQSFGLPKWSIIRRVVVPAALPAVLSGLAFSTSLAILLLVSAEMIDAQEGIGAFVFSSGNLMQTDRLLAGVALVSLIGFIAGGMLRGLGHLAARRHPRGF